MTPTADRSSPVSLDVAVVGSLNLDDVVRVGRLPRPGETVSAQSSFQAAGGKGLNQAIAARRSGSTIAMIGAVGDDAAGRQLRAALVGEGIDVTRVATLAGASTGSAFVAVDDDAENLIVVRGGANQLLEPRLDEMARARVVLAQLEVPPEGIAAVFDRARAAGAITVLNPAPASGLTRDLVAVCDVVIPNEHEVDTLGGPEALLDAGVSTVVVTRGKAGCRVITRERAVDVAAFDVLAVDTTGAGDAFCGAFASRLATGADLLDAVVHASAAGALATTIPGAAPSIPTSAQIAQLRRTQVHVDGSINHVDGGARPDGCADRPPSPREDDRAQRT